MKTTTEKMVFLCSIALISLTAVVNKHHTTHAFVAPSTFTTSTTTTTTTMTSFILKLSSPPRMLSTLRASTTASYDRSMFSSSGEEEGKEDVEPNEQPQSKKEPRISKRSRFLNFLGIKKLPKKKIMLSHEDDDDEYETPESWEGHAIKVSTEQGLDEYFADTKHRFRFNNNNNKTNDTSNMIDYDSLLATLHVEGDTQIIGSPDHPQRVHPVLQLLHDRRRTSHRGLKHWRENDGHKVALVIEGGGMRGCVSAGMVAAIHYLGLEDTFDVIYGSSAGSVIGSYFITRQLPWYGPEIYYDSLSKAGLEFIDTKRITRAVGLGLLDPRLLKDVIVRPKHGKPVLNLAYLLKKTAQKEKPLDWETFKERQSVQPLKIVASALNREASVILDMEKGSFGTLNELTDCMHASCLLPGITGPLVHTKVPPLTKEDGTEDGSTVTDETVGNNEDQPQSNKDDNNNSSSNNNDENDSLEPLADALIYEPLPYHSAIKEGATHVVVLRTRPDGVDVTGKTNLFERLILKRFFLRKNYLPHIYKRMRQHLHKKQYAKDVIALNKAAHDNERDYSDTSKPHLMTIAVGPGAPEVTKLETGRKEIFEGVRRGFARAYDALVEDSKERGRGEIVAKQYFPDEILDYNPSKIDSSSGQSSAFEVFLRELEEKGGGYDHLPDTLGKTAAQSGKSR